MALTKKHKQIIKDVSKYLSVAEMAVRFGVEEKEIYSYLKEIKIKPLVTSGNVDANQKKIALNNLENGSADKKEIKSKNFSFFGVIAENWKFLAALCIGVFVLYFNSLNGDYVSDDYATITQDPNILNLGKNIQTGLIPIIYKSVIAIFFGVKDPFAFHLFSVILYMLVCVAAFVLLRIIFDKKIASLSTILFAVLPIHVEAVSWISGEPYLLMSFFILMILTFFVIFLDSNKKRYLAFMLAYLVLLYFTDRFRGFSVVLLAFLYLVCFKERLKFKINWLKLFLVTAAISVVVLIFSWPMISARIGSVNNGYNGSDTIFYEPWIQYPTSIAKYLQLMLMPTDLTLYHTMYIIPMWLNWSILIVFLASLGYFFVKNKKLFFALAFIFLAAAGSMSPVKVGWLVAERYLFLGSLGFALFLILALKPLAEKMKVLAWIAFVVVVLIYGMRVITRNIDWQTNHNLWVSSVQVSPNSHNAWNNIGDDYDKLGQLENAVKGFTQSTIVKQNYADAYHNRANIFYKAGRYDLARESYEMGLSYGPNLYQSYFSLIQIDLIEKKYDLALSHIEKLQKVKPNDIQVYYVTAVVYLNMGEKEKAVSLLEKIIKAAPTFSDAQNLLKQIKSV